MGMYTDFAIEVTLKPDTPKTVLRTLKYLVHDREDLFKGPVDRCLDEYNRSEESKRFISTERFCYIGNPDYELPFGHTAWEFDGTRLVIGTNVKNYDSVIEKFWAWISPWIDEPVGTSVGYCQYEEYVAPSEVIVGQDIESGENHYMRGEGFA